MPPYTDIADSGEDDRIRLIGEQAMNEHKVVGFITDDEPCPIDGTKADRYIRKLRERFPGIRVVARGKGPVADTVWIKVAPPLN